MAMLALTKNASFEFNGINGVVEDVKARYILLDFDGRGLEMYTPYQLQDAYIEGEFKILESKSVHVVSNITDPVMSERYDFINTTLKFMHDSGFPMSERIAIQAIDYAISKCGLLDGKKPSASAAKRWYTKWRNNNQSVTYVLKKSKERRRSQFTRECESLADQVIADNYLQLHGCSIGHTYQIFLQEFNKLKPEWDRRNAEDNQKTNETVALIKPMSRSTFYTYIDQYDAYEVDKARLGVKTARKKHRCVKGSIITNRPLERVEVDALHPNICIKVKLADGSFSYVHPIIYVAIDVHTRIVVGYVVDYSEGKPGESANSVVELIKQICNPFKLGKHTGKPFPLGGMPESIVSDSGPAFIATIVKMMMQSHSIEHCVTQKASPWKKPFIERLFLTFKMQFMTTLPGYVGPRIRGVELDNTMEELAQLSKIEFETKLEEYILNVYHYNPHKGLDDWSPIDTWEEMKDRCAPLLLCDFTNTLKFHGELLERVISSPKGFKINGIDYNCPEIQSLVHTLSRRNKNKPGSRRVKVMYNPLDISEVTVINPIKEELICVPAITRGVFSGITLSEFNTAKQARKDRNPKSVESYAMHTIKPQKREAKSSNDNAPPALDITKPLSSDEVDKVFTNGIGKHADSHSHKPVVQGAKPSAPVAATSANPIKPSIRR
jgi:putative transposase